MENKIIINERFAGIFEKVMQNNDEIKRALEPKYSITKKAAYNRAVINALFSILKATSGPYYEEYIDDFVFFNFVGCHNKISYEKLNIDLNKCVDDIGVIRVYFDKQVSESDEFYRIIKEELDNFYGKNYNPYPNLGYFAELVNRQQNEQQQIVEQQMRPIYNGEMFYANNPYTNQQFQPQIQPVHYKANEAYNKSIFSGNPYIYPISGPYGSVFNQQQMDAINDITFNKIPLFWPDGKPMNKAAEKLAKAIDCRIEEYEKTKARNRRNTK